MTVVYKSHKKVAISPISPVVLHATVADALATRIKDDTKGKAERHD